MANKYKYKQGPEIHGPSGIKKMLEMLQVKQLAPPCQYHHGDQKKHDSLESNFMW